MAKRRVLLVARPAKRKRRSLESLALVVGLSSAIAAVGSGAKQASAEPAVVDVSAAKTPSRQDGRPPAKWLAQRAGVSGTSDAFGDPRGVLRLLKVRHATYLIEIAGVRILTDPWLTRAPGGPLVLEAPEPALDVNSLGVIDILLVTSSSWDRFDPWTARTLRSRTSYCLVPDEGTAAQLRSAGFSRVRTVIAGDVLDVRGVHVEVSPVAYEDDDEAGDSVGYRLSAAGRSVWHAGPLLPLDVNDAPGLWIRERPTEVVLAGWDPGPGATLGFALGSEDAILLARLARARFLFAQGDDVRPAIGWRWLTSLLIADAPPPKTLVDGIRVMQPEQGLWYRIARGPRATPR